MHTANVTRTSICTYSYMYVQNYSLVYLFFPPFPQSAYKGALVSGHLHWITLYFVHVIVHVEKTSLQKIKCGIFHLGV